MSVLSRVLHRSEKFFGFIVKKVFFKSRSICFEDRLTIIVYAQQLVYWLLVIITLSLARKGNYVYLKLFNYQKRFMYRGVATNSGLWGQFKSGHFLYCKY